MKSTTAKVERRATKKMVFQESNGFTFAKL